MATKHESRKLKLDQSAIFRFFLTLFLGAVLIYFVIMVLDARSWGPGLHTFDYLMMALFAFLGLIQLILYFKTKNSTYLGMGIALLLFIPYLYTGQSKYSDLRYLFYAGWGILFFTSGPIRKSSNPHFRQVLELAARPVDELGNGFTPRPYPAGKWKYTEDEITRFGKFLMKHRITTTFTENDCVVLAISGFSWRYFLYGKPNIQNMTCVAFDFSGNVSVNITQKDYQKFRSQLTFDRAVRLTGKFDETVSAVLSK